MVAKWIAAVIAAATLVLWIGTRWYGVSWVTPYDFQANAWQGRITAHIGRVTTYPISQYFFDVRYDPGQLDFGVHWYKRPISTTVDVPIWIFVVAAVVVTHLLWRRDRIAWLRDRPHLCVKCGYDQSGLPANVVCPECGKARGVP